jgi:hypothetical protein
MTAIDYAQNAFAENSLGLHYSVLITLMPRKLWLIEEDASGSKPSGKPEIV